MKKSEVPEWMGQKKSRKSNVHSGGLSHVKEVQYESGMGKFPCQDKKILKN